MPSIYSTTEQNAAMAAAVAIEGTPSLESDCQIDTMQAIDGLGG